MTTTQEWIEELKGISVLELAERIKALEEEFGVSATAGAGAAAADGDGAAEEQSTFDVVLTGAGDKKIQVIKVVRAATGLGLKEAKARVETLAPCGYTGPDRPIVEAARSAAPRHIRGRQRGGVRESRSPAAVGVS